MVVMIVLFVLGEIKIVLFNLFIVDDIEFLIFLIFVVILFGNVIFEFCWKCLLCVRYIIGFVIKLSIEKISVREYYFC